MLENIRYSLRQFIKTPGFTITAILTLALGIGATTAIFTLVHAVLVKSLPVRRPANLFAWATTKTAASTAAWRTIGRCSPPSNIESSATTLQDLSRLPLFKLAAVRSASVAPAAIVRRNLSALIRLRQRV